LGQGEPERYEMTSIVPKPLIGSPFPLRFRARGALINALFGTVFMFEGLIFGGIATPVWLVTIALPAVLIIGRAAIQMKTLRNQVRSSADLQSWKAIAIPFWIDTAAEWLLVAGGVIVLARLRRYGLIPQWVALIVGLHYFPLGKLFNTRRFYALGLALVLVALGSLLLPAGNIRNVVACMGAGLCLWTTAVVSLATWPVPPQPQIDATSS
jgi:hypothetical protein